MVEEPFAYRRAPYFRAAPPERGGKVDFGCPPVLKFDGYSVPVSLEVLISVST